MTFDKHSSTDFGLTENLSSDAQDEIILSDRLVNSSLTTQPNSVPSSGLISPQNDSKPESESSGVISTIIKRWQRVPNLPKHPTTIQLQLFSNRSLISLVFVLIMLSGVHIQFNSTLELPPLVNHNLIPLVLMVLCGFKFNLNSTLEVPTLLSRIRKYFHK